MCLSKKSKVRKAMKNVSTGLNACNLGYGDQRTRISHRCHGEHGEHRKNCKWYGDRVERGASRAGPG